MALIRTSRSPLHPDSGMVHPVAGEITPKAIYEGRRTWLKEAAAIGGMASGLGGLLLPDDALAQTAVKRPG